MGNGASSTERDRSADASDLKDIDSALMEISRLRHMARESKFAGFEAEVEKPLDASDMPSDLRVCIAEVQRLRALIKVKIPTAERLRKQVKRETAQENLDMNARLFQRKFQDAVEILAEVNDTKIHQIRAINDPIPQLKLAVEGVAVLIFQNKKKKKHLNKWKISKEALGELNFRQKLVKFNLDTVKPKARKHIARICDDPKLADVEISANSANATVMDTVAYAFMAWVRAVNGYCQAIYPKKEAIKQLTSEINALRTPEEELGERFMNTRLAGLKTLHRFLDKDGNGEVSFKELQKFITRYNCKDIKKKKKNQKDIRKQVDVAFDQARLLTTRGDVDGKYVCASDLDFTEFVSFMLTIFHVIFIKIDRNRNGTVEQDEVKELLTIMYGAPDKKKKGSETKHVQMFKKLKKCGKKGGELTQDVFTDFMIKILNTKTSKKRNVLARLLTMAVSDADWEAGKKAGAQTTFIQTTLAAEVSGQHFMRADHAMAAKGPGSIAKKRKGKKKKKNAAGEASPAAAGEASPAAAGEESPAAAGEEASPAATEAAASPKPETDAPATAV